MRTRFLTALLIALVVCAGALEAQKPPQNELGFHPDKLYQFGDLDSVNLFNGNLIIRIPIGHGFPVNSHLTDALTLVYNGNVWDYQRKYNDNDPTTYYYATPNRRSNAGLGWRISLGRLIDPGDRTVFNPYDESGLWVYESAAGDEHSFGTGVGDPTVQISNDTSALRLVKISTTSRKVEFPDGAVHQFAKSNGKWRLTSISDRFGNSINVSYASDDSSWTITDSIVGNATLRTSYFVSFTHYTEMNDSIDDGWTVSSITVTSQGGTQSSYTFTYDQTPIPWGCNHQPKPYEPPSSSTAPRLSRLTLPDSTKFDFTYYGGIQGDCSTGQLNTMTLPTGGVATYKYQPYRFPSGLCVNPPPNSIVPGVSEKQYMGGTWTYIQTVGPDYPNMPPDTEFGSPCGTGPDSPGIIPPKRWSRTTVLAPQRNGETTRARTDNYFNVWVGPSGFHEPWGADAIPYGVSVTAGAPALSDRGDPTVEVADADARTADSGSYVYLSTRMFDGCNATTGDCSAASVKVLRSSYLRYRPSDLSGPQVEASRTVFHDDGDRYTEETYSQSNGVGRFRKMEHTTSFENNPSFSTFTNYSTWTSTDKLNANLNWLLDTYTEQSRTESGATARTLTCFDSSGFLFRTRRLAGALPGASDILTTFAQTAGNVTDQSEYGGDVQALGTPTEAQVCTAAPPVTPPQYRIQSSYSNGALASSAFVDPANPATILLKTTDRDIDAASGLVTAARDASGIATSYSYDSFGRLSSVSTPGTATLSYSYTNPGTGTNAKITETTAASSGSIQRVVEFDPFGRILRDSRKTAASEWIAQEFSYDAWSRKLTETVPVSLTAAPTGTVTGSKTFFDYDAFGRIVKTTAPDSKETQVTYTGSRLVDRSVKIAMPPAGTETSVTTTETYDSQGRLVSVTEPSGPTSVATPTGGDVTTSYGYDVGGRLTSVTMTGAETGAPVQSRSFSYDLRGFLKSETSPEGGTTSYSEFDPRGHAKYKMQSGAAASTFNLRMTYDAAERLTQIDQATTLAPANSPGSATFRVFKQFTYGTANGTFNSVTDYTTGKLTEAKRYNYTSAGTYVVAESYHYADTAGRRTAKTTTVSTGSGSTIRTIDQSVAYDNLGLRTTITYPTCTSCGTGTQASLSPTYSYGRLATIPGYLTSITYAPTGMPATMTHGNGIVDTQDVDPNGIARPRSIKFASWSACTAPSPAGPADTSVQWGSAVTLSAASGGTTPLSYQWYRSTDGGSFTAIAGANGSTFSEVPPASPTYYRVDVWNVCRTVTSRTATVTVIITPPSITTQPQSANVDGTGRAQFSVTASGTPTLHYHWYEGTAPDRTRPAGTDASAFTTPVLTVTTRYWVEVTNAATPSAISQTVKALVALPTPLSLTATRSGSTQTVNVTWSASLNAARYELWRRKAGDAGFVSFAIVSAPATSFADTLAAGTAAAYEVRALDSDLQSASGFSPVDVGSTINFTTITTGMIVRATYFDELLSALNALRAIHNDAALTWAAILPAGAGAPAPGVIIKTSHVTSLRDRMNAALAAVGAASDGAPAVATGTIISRTQMLDLQRKAQ